MSNIRVKIFSSFCDGAEAARMFSRHLHKYFAPNNVTYVVDPKDTNFTHVLIINTAMPGPHLFGQVPKSNVIGVAFEPPVFLNMTMDFINYARKYIGTYYIGTTNDVKVIYKDSPFQTFFNQALINLNNSPPFVSGYSYMWYDCPHNPAHINNRFAQERIENPNKVSFILSRKQMTVGHKLRYEILKQIVLRDLPIDIWGNGAEKHVSSAMAETGVTELKNVRVCGEFGENDVYKPYAPYYFTIAIENTSLPHYCSEKFINPLVYNCVPIYWGCTNIDTIFPKMKGKYVSITMSEIDRIADIIDATTKTANSPEYAMPEGHLFDLVKDETDIRQIFQ